MAEISIEVVNGVAVLRVTGHFTSEDQTRALLELYPNVQQQHVIWDFSGCTRFDISAEQMRAAPKQVQSHSQRAAGSITVFACPAINAYGMFRLYVAHAEMTSLPFHYHVTRSFDAALKYIAKIEEGAS